MCHSLCPPCFWKSAVAVGAGGNVVSVAPGVNLSRSIALALTESTLVRQVEIDNITLSGALTLTLDTDENWWISYFSIPQITQVRTDGGVVTYPLTTASVGTSAYNQMLARGLHYEASLDTLYLVTRGTGSRGDIYEISNLP